MKRPRAFIILLSLLAAALWPGMSRLLSAAAPPDLEEQVHHIAAELRCPVCQNLSVADSPSGLAQEMRDLIREQLQQGRSRGEIVAFFVSKYGEWVLLTPKPGGFNLLVYVVPFVAGAAGVAGALVAIRRWVRRRRDRAEALPEVSAADRERLRLALEADDEEKTGAPTGEWEGPLADLEGQRAALYATIRELEFDHNSGMISREDYEDMGRRYEAEAVALLRRLNALGVGASVGAASDTVAARSSAHPSAAPARVVAAEKMTKEIDDEIKGDAGPSAREPRRRLWMAAGAMTLVAFGVGAGALLTLSIRPRPEGGSITGDPLTGTRSEMPPLASASAAEPGQAGQRPQPLDPATLARMLQSAHASLDAGKLSEASAAYRAVLERDPATWRP